LGAKSHRNPDHFTLLIVPHTQQEPISLHMPHWALYLCLLAVAILAAGLVLLIRDYRNAQAQLALLQQERQTELDRQRAMRETILSQDEQVRGLTAEAGRLSDNVASMDRLVEEVRRIVGLERLTPTSAVSGTITATTVLTAPTLYAPSQDHALGALGQSAAGGILSPWGNEDRAAASVSSRGAAGGALDSRYQVQQVDSGVVQRLAGLRQLRDLVIARVAAVDADKRTDPVALEQALALYDAAPKLAPLHGPINITSGFGMRVDPVSPWYSGFHYGIDISAWYGTPVYATKAGKVVYATWQGNLGWTVEIQHEMGYKTVYGHNRDLVVHYGDEVEADQLIAHAGDTGRTTGPHVHYEIRLNGQALDPAKYLSAQGGSVVQSQR